VARYISPLVDSVRRSITVAQLALTFSITSAMPSPTAIWTDESAPATVKEIGRKCGVLKGRVRTGQDERELCRGGEKCSNTCDVTWLVSSVHCFSLQYSTVR
jgi:hypothetical protein